MPSASSDARSARPANATASTRAFSMDACTLPDHWLAKCSTTSPTNRPGACCASDWAALVNNSIGMGPLAFSASQAATMSSSDSAADAAASALSPGRALASAARFALPFLGAEKSKNDNCGIQPAFANTWITAKPTASQKNSPMTSNMSSGCTSASMGKTAEALLSITGAIAEREDRFGEGYVPHTAVMVCWVFFSVRRLER
mmetsp:Transcript_91350/g.263663  ORF Transcript_91350/g.263663 Transcript_91350/m.263663 type:complete len:202 (+) Transcript_91350:2848-3453(+)